MKNTFITSIPKEVVIVICFFLPSVKDINSFSLVCHDWYKNANSNEIWKKRCFIDFPHIPKNSSEHILWKDEYFYERFEHLNLLRQFSEEHNERMRHRNWMLCGMHMFHPVNGRFGFDLLPKPEVDIPIPSEEVMKAMLKREDELRLSDKYQEMFANPGKNAIHIAEIVQEQVAEEFGYTLPETKSQIIAVIRAAAAFYSPEICSIPHYVKFNKSAKGNFDVGSTLKDVKLAQLNGQETTLFSYIKSLRYQERPILICSGSYS